VSEERKTISAEEFYIKYKKVAIVALIILCIAGAYLLGTNVGSKGIISEDDIYYHTEENEKICKIKVIDKYKIKGKGEIYALNLGSADFFGEPVIDLKLTKSDYNKYVGSDNNAIRVKELKYVLHFYADDGRDELISIDKTVYPWSKDDGKITKEELKEYAEKYIGRSYSEVNFNDYYHSIGEQSEEKPLFRDSKEKGVLTIKFE